MGTIQLMSKVDAATIQERPPIKGEIYSIKQLLSAAMYHIKAIV